MAFSSKLVKYWYKDLSVEELEMEYKNLEKEFVFESKEAQIKCILNNFLNASYRTNINSKRLGLEELLKEKTGKEYKIEDKYFQITLKDLIDYVSENNTLLSSPMVLTNFFNEIIDVSEREKINFLIYILQDKKTFSDFINEIKENQNAKIIFEKYLEIAKNFCMRNNRKG